MLASALCRIWETEVDSARLGRCSSLASRRRLRSSALLSRPVWAAPRPRRRSNREMPWHPRPILSARSPRQMPPGVQQNLDNLADAPATHTGFTFDRTMMGIAQGVLQSGGIDADRAAAALSSIRFDTYRYPQPVFYTPEAMAPSSPATAPPAGSIWSTATTRRPTPPSPGARSPTSGCTSTAPTSTT